MTHSAIRFQLVRCAVAFLRSGGIVCAVAATLCLPVCAQQASERAPAVGAPGLPSPSAGPENQPVASQANDAPPPASSAAPIGPAAVTAKEADFASSETGAISEEEVRRMLVGKPLFLRGGYLDNSLNFSEHGQLLGHSPQGSFTLNGLEINKVRLTKHKVELEGIRFGLHFVGQLAYEDPSKAVDRVRITPQKKMVKISIDREQVVTPKKKKEKKEKEGKNHGLGKGPEDYSVAKLAASASATGEADENKVPASAAAEAERPADPRSVTTTISPAHAAKVLRDALDKIFAPGLDDRMLASLPDFWKLYYQAVAAHSDYRPSDPAVLRQSAVDTKAKLQTTFEPPSNEFAQASAVAGMALYHTVIGPDGKPAEIAVGRPIGFGLDENAVESIRKASFAPALKDGKPVPVLLDLVVQFRIYSKRTAVIGSSEASAHTKEQVLPGPYSVKR